MVVLAAIFWKAALKAAGLVIIVLVLLLFCVLAAASDKDEQNRQLKIQIDQLQQRIAAIAPRG